MDYITSLDRENLVALMEANQVLESDYCFMVPRERRPLVIRTYEDYLAAIFDRNNAFTRTQLSPDQIQQIINTISREDIIGNPILLTDKF